MRKVLISSWGIAAAALGAAALAADAQKPGGIGEHVPGLAEASKPAHDPVGQAAAPVAEPAKPAIADDANRSDRRHNRRRSGGRRGRRQPRGHGPGSRTSSLGACHRGSGRSSWHVSGHG